MKDFAVRDSVGSVTWNLHLTRRLSDIDIEEAINLTSLLAEYELTEGPD